LSAGVDFNRLSPFADHLSLIVLPRSSKKHYLNFVIFSVFTLAFASFLVYGGYHLITGTENVTIKSLAPGVPAFFLFFLTRKEWRSAVASRNMERRRANAVSRDEF